MTSTLISIRLRTLSVLLFGTFAITVAAAGPDRPLCRIRRLQGGRTQQQLDLRPHLRPVPRLLFGAFRPSGRRSPRLRPRRLADHHAYSGEIGPRVSVHPHVLPAMPYLEALGGIGHYDFGAGQPSNTEVRISVPRRHRSHRPAAPRLASRRVLLWRPQRLQRNLHPKTLSTGRCSPASLTIRLK